jgi:hypothetical protein
MQFKTVFAILQRRPAGLVVVSPPAVATAKPVYPVPAFSQRK